MPFRKKSHVQNSRRRPVAEVFEKRFLLSVDLPGLEAANDPFLANDFITDGELRLIRSAMPAVMTQYLRMTAGYSTMGR